MTDIVTITMNPAVDVATSVERISERHKLRCGPAQQHPGGGGINVARVLRRLGTDCLALYAAGGGRGEQLRMMLDDEGIPRMAFPIAGETRENFSVHERCTGHEYRFVLPGPRIEGAELGQFEEVLRSVLRSPRYVVLSGSLPPGAPPDFYARLARLAKSAGARVVLDASGEALAAALDERVHLVKPSLRELRELDGRPLESESQWSDAANRLISAGRAQMVALSLGEQGALLCAAGQSWRAAGLPVQVRSTIGAGDSFLAGLLWALDRGERPDTAFRYAIAAGTAALLASGTALCQPADVDRYAELVAVRPAGPA